MKIDGITGADQMQRSIVENARAHVEDTTERNNEDKLEQMRENTMDPKRGTIFDSQA
jgi:hypothetical protein